MVVKAVSEHLVRQVDRRIKDRHLDHVGASTNPMLTREYMRGQVPLFDRRNYPIIHDLLVIFHQHRPELRDIGTLRATHSVQSTAQERWNWSWLTSSSFESPVPSKQRTKVRPARATPPTLVIRSTSGVEQWEAVVDMFGSEGEAGLAGVYKPLGERRRSLPFLTPQEPVNLVKLEVDLVGSDLDRFG